MSINSAAVKDYLIELQNRLCDTFSQEDGKATFLEDIWQRQEGGGGSTRILENGNVFEKGAVNFSHVFGSKLPISATASHPELTQSDFEAMGISMIFHPDNPHTPTMHANLRLFVAETKAKGTIWWFGGGCDLTPYYGYKEDCQHWHRTLKAACDPFGENKYKEYKKWCDEYFYLKHRQEPRGIGGIFFDDINDGSFEECFRFIKSIGDSILPAYLPIVQKRKSIPFHEKQKNFQAYRRGRYVEFNLVYDRGTLFGLQSNGRTESILASLPPNVRWEYDWHPQANTPEAELYDVFLQPRDWC